MIVEPLALAVAALFAGAAVYVSIAEHPTRMKLDDRAALAEWGPAYKRGFAMQASLAIVGFVLGFWAWRHTGHVHWLTGASILIAAWPYTMIVMMRTNKRLMTMVPAEAGPDSRALLKKWGQMHAIRTGLGLASVVMFVLASLET
jgi:hypothetical protein